MPRWKPSSSAYCVNCGSDMMSSDAARPTNGAAVPELDRLELTVRRLLDEHDALLRRVAAADRRVQELEAALAQLSTGRVDPGRIADRARVVEKENRALHRRLELARDAVRRIQARLRFIGEDRQ